MLTERCGCISFMLGDDGFGMSLDCIREIVPAGRVAPVPLAPRVVKGLANVRGRVITLIDVAALLSRSLPPARIPEDRIALLLREPYEHLGVYVHAPVEIVQTSAAMLRSGAAATAGASGDAQAQVETEARGVPGRPVETDGRVLHLLSAGDLMARCENTILEGFRRQA